MKRIRLERWGSQLLPHRTPARPLCPCSSLQQTTLQPHSRRAQSGAATETSYSTSTLPIPHPSRQSSRNQPLETLPSPPPSAALSSAKLAALRARLSIPTRLPLQTLARTLVHPSADPDPAFNNSSLATLGANLMGYYSAEHIISHYPRLPTQVLFVVQDAYIGPDALTAITSEWGVEAAAEPGGEVDPGLLQFRRLRSGESPITAVAAPFKKNWNQSITGKLIHGDEFGSYKSQINANRVEQYKSFTSDNPLGVPLEDAASAFVRAVVGATYLHCGRATAKRFFTSHFLSRHLDMSSVFDFRTPTRDLSRLCAREDFEPPVARLISETGRKSRHPVYVVGVYSGRDKLGEGAGSSLNEARTRAAANALKSWYLYKPVEVTLPSSVEGVEPAKMGEAGVKWIPNVVDCGEVIT